MTFFIFTFLTSFVAMVFMLWYKLHELKTGKRFFWSTVIPHTDQALQVNVDYGKHIVSSINRDNAFRFLVIAHRFCLMTYVMTRRQIEKGLSHVIEISRGKRLLKNKGAASFFMKNITEHKSTFTNRPR